MLRRLTGLIVLLMVSVGLAISIGGIIFVHGVLGRPTAVADEQLTLITDSLDTLSEAINTVSEGLDTASTSLDTLQSNTLGLTDVVSNTYPSLQAADSLLNQDMPERLRGIEELFPVLVQSTAAIDQALVQVGEFEAELVNLGLLANARIQYQPEIPLSEAVGYLGSSLEGLPEQLASVGPLVDQGEEQLLIVEQSIQSINDLTETISGEIERLGQNMEEFSELIARANGMTNDLSTDLVPLLDMVKPIATILLVWLGLSQIAPLYVGLQLLE